VQALYGQGLAAAIVMQFNAKACEVGAQPIACAFFFEARCMHAFPSHCVFSRFIHDCQGQMCLESSPNALTDFFVHTPHASLLLGTRAVSSAAMIDSLHALGGLQVRANVLLCYPPEQAHTQTHLTKYADIVRLPRAHCPRRSSSRCSRSAPTPPSCTRCSPCWRPWWQTTLFCRLRWHD
jgi:hypothetical protein